LKPAQENRKAFTKIGLVDWLKVKVLSSSACTAKKKKRRRRNLEVTLSILTLFSIISKSLS
jgi:hypothetical protein